MGTYMRPFRRLHGYIYDVSGLSVQEALRGGVGAQMSSSAQAFESTSGSR